MALVVDELIDLVRDDIDEDNVVDISDADILQKLNRALRKAVLKVIKNYDNMFITSRTVTTVSGTSDYAWAPNVYAGKIKKLELLLNGRAYPITRLWYRQSAPYVRPGTTTRPTHYELFEKKWRLYGTPAGGLSIQETYVRVPEKLVKQQGRVVSFGTDVATSQPYVVVDSLPEDTDLSTSSDGLNNYVNFIDYNTGAVRGSAQIASIDTANNRVLFKASGLTRTSVLGKTISTELPTDLAADDYICTIHGTCVPEIPEAYFDYLTQKAVVDIKRSKGEPTQEDYSALKDEEKDVEQINMGNEHRVQISRINPVFNRRRY